MTDRICSSTDAVSHISSGDRVYIHGMAAVPQALVNAMSARGSELRDVEVVHLHTEGVAPYAEVDMAHSFRVNALFVGANMREPIFSGRADYIPIFLSEVPALLRSGAMPIDVVLIQVSPPDRHGFCSLGVSVEATLSAVRCARLVIAQVNRLMPRTHGDGFIHVNEIDYMVEQDAPIFEANPIQLTEVDERIGEHCASLIKDGSTLQMGIGAIPNAVLASLKSHRRLGIHSEMISDGVIPLIESGVVTGTEKKTHPGKIVAGFVYGSRKLYDFVDDNPSVALLDIEYVNNTEVIRRNPKVSAINSAIEVDVTGQVCADSIGERIYSGVGGQMDFIRGASLSEGGCPIIALPSTTRHGVSRIVPTLNAGAGVVTTRAHIHFVVTEYGVADLHGKNLRQRAKALIDISHPAHRESLERSAFDRFGSLSNSTYALSEPSEASA